MNHQSSFVPQNGLSLPLPLTQPLNEFPLMDSGLAVPVFSPRDDTTSYLNKAMAFLTAATIQDGRVTMQQVQGRQGQSYVGNGNKGNANRSGGTNAGWQARVVKCYNLSR
ncbi:hypothetical protein Tco_1070900 [Tanacetum coccineum]|uniref:Uncharacterized protein n=1 Tax=Tanacetum coccineum TaxID=301880 RepID=A0ABQ5HPV5_9ASTR